jgi:hypothetical protein
VARDASEALGSPQVAGTFVSPKGHTRNLTARVAGFPGGEVAAGAPKFGDVGYVALSEDELAIVTGKHGLFKPKVGSEVIARASRTDITAAELDGGALKAAMRFQFADGGSWEFEVPKIYRKTAEQVVRALGGSVS